MAACARITGKDLYVEFDSVDLSGDFRGFDTTEEIGTVDLTAGDDTGKCYGTLHTDGKATFTSLYTSTAGAGAGSAAWAAVVPGTEGSLVWGERGTTTGYPRHHVTAFVISRARTHPYDGALESTVEFQFNDSSAVTDGLWT